MKQEICNLLVTWLPLIATLITIGIAICQIIKQQKLTKATNHIELRKMFSEEKRFAVHANLRPGGKWSDRKTGPSSQEDWLIVEDYLGLFENCEKMLKDKVLDEELFKNSYEYRLKNIAANPVIKAKINNAKEDWTLFKKLLERYNIKIDS